MFPDNRKYKKDSNICPVKIVVFFTHLVSILPMLNEIFKALLMFFLHIIPGMMDDLIYFPVKLPFLHAEVSLPSPGVKQRLHS